MTESLDSDEATRQQIIALEAQVYANPSSRHDVDHLLASEFWEVSATGEKVARGTLLKRLASSPIIVDGYPLDDTRVDIYGDVAISTGRAVLQGRLPLEDATEQVVERSNRFVHVWVKRGDTWQAVFAQSSDAPMP